MVATARLVVVSMITTEPEELPPPSLLTTQTSLPSEVTASAYGSSKSGLVTVVTTVLSSVSITVTSFEERFGT